MKFVAIFALFALCSCEVETQQESNDQAIEQMVKEQSEDRTITKVVKLLQEMLEKSQKEGDEERVIYAKFKCYCDTSEAEKKASIKKETESIALLENQIAEIQGDTGGLSSECANLKVKMAENEAARDEATAIRKKEKTAYDAEKADLEQAITQMKEAIETLAAVGADQTESTGADNKQFMAGMKGSLISLNTEVKSALKAASALMTTKDQGTAAAFLQGPFTGTYSSQSAAVMGIIKNMRDTFEKNLREAIATEEASVKSYDAFMKIKKEAWDDMKESYESKQKSLGGNDKELATKKEQLAESKKQLANDEEFLEKLLPMCAEKAEGYSKRKVMRANEEAALAEAVSILNSDSAFATFGTTDATSTGATKFLQLRAIKSHRKNDAIIKVLSESKSARLLKVAALVQAENAFDTVLAEIDKMLVVIKEEAKADKENLDWCNDERKTNKASLAKKEQDIIDLNDEIDKLDKAINDPKTGLKAMIQETEETLVANKEAQTTETADRTEDNVAYQKDIANLVAAEGIVAKAIKVLKAYYDDLAAKLEAGEALLQEDPDAPDAWKGDGGDDSRQFAGQSESGNKVIGQLEFILENTKTEETEAHSEEEKAQASYEDSMTDLKAKEEAAEQSLVNLNEELAEKEKSLLQNQEDLKETTADKEAIEAYLAKIKPGCDFITENFDTREANRATEKAALEKAIGLIKATPAYTNAVNAQTVEDYGDCKEPCVKDEADVKCKACLADVTIPAYCAGHKGTAGC